MKSNLQERLFLFLWLIFFIVLIYREFNSAWIPDYLKTRVVQWQLDLKNDHILETLDALSRAEIPQDFEEYDKIHLHFPLFVFRDNELIYWNSSEYRPPPEVILNQEGLSFRDNGFNKVLYLVRRGSDNLVLVGLNPLWKDVGIQNQWLNNGSDDSYYFNWFLSEDDECNSEINVTGDMTLSICFIDSSKKAMATDSAEHFVVIMNGILLFLFGFLIIRKYSEVLGDQFKKKVFLISIGGIAFLLLYEYSRRFLFAPHSESAFFVIYPFLLSFFAALAVVNSQTIKWPELFRHPASKIVFLFAVYAFCKSYWIEIFDKDSYDLDLINFVRLEWKTLDAYLGLYGMSLFFAILITSVIRHHTVQGRQVFGPVLILSLLIGAGLFIVESVFFGEWYFGYILLAILIALRFSFAGLFKGRLKYSGVTFTVITIFLVSLLITETLYYGNIRKDRKLAREYAAERIGEEERIATQLLSIAREKIREDRLFYLVLTNPMTSKEIIKQKIKKVYLDSYFDPFEVRIDFLSANGDNLNSQSGYRNFYFFENNYLLPENRIADGIYKIEDPEGLKGNDYFLNVELVTSGYKFGNIIVEVYRDRSTPNSIFPKLLVDGKYRNPHDDKYESSLFHYDSLKVSRIAAFPERIKNDLLELEDEESLFLDDGEKHRLFMRIGDDFVMVEEKRGSVNTTLSGFSIAFMILAVMTMLLYLVGGIGTHFRLSYLPFRRKIQLFMNLAFLLPLLIVSLSVIKFMNDNNRENVESNYLEKVRVIAGGIQIPFLDYQNGLIPRRVFEERSAKAAGAFSLDYFIYDNDGILNSSSKEILWERGITNKQIESGAFSKLNRSDFFIRETAIDDFEYKIAYASLKDLNNRQIGILGVPFYESNEELEERFILLLSTVINIFVFTFIVFLFFSNKLTDWLMVPVIKLSERIKITSFQSENEPLEWDTSDEIGALVKSYNEMIDKLNKSREALAKTEKEAAWREMAQQVAHEIKNPLTPMRLRLQQLIRQQRESDKVEKLEKTLQSLLHQVDALSEIASSFSEFARMPNPKNELVNFNEVIGLASDIYMGKPNIAMNISLPGYDIMVEADENMLSRSIGNIILNGIQSVESESKAEISISLEQKGRLAILKITDNGVGIDESLHDRIFIPHFSTKSGGTGIGLALARKTVDGANGSIYFKSKAGKGTTFFIELPIKND